MALLAYWGGLLQGSWVCMRMRGSGENSATQPPSLFSPFSNRALVLCLQLSSTPCFSTLRDQAPGSTSLPSFASDAAVFPGPLLPKDCGFDLFVLPLCGRVSPSNGRMSNGRMLAAPRNPRWTLLLPGPGDCGQVPAAPEKVLEIV